ncbi:MAG: hypothetical protein IPM29_21385 [Planctomycetes bacterium]|nr:hypothetical protein [Planctomycetota bacterium]
MLRSARRRLLDALVVGLVTAPVLAQDSSAGSLEAGFREPPLAARPMVLWPWLNGHVDRAQLTQELEEMRAKGLRGALIWDIGSLADPDHVIPSGPAFLGPESLASIHHALDEAARLGLELGLVASSSWNAGGPWIEPADASKELRFAARRVTGPAAFDDAPPRPDNLSGPFDEVALLAVATDDQGRARPGSEPLDLSAALGADGRLHWQIPAGDWTILRFVCCGTGQRLVCPSPQSSGLLVDHLSRAATDRHFEVMLDRLFAGGERPAALTHMMLDSFEVWPRTDWTPGFAGVFATTYGYDPLPHLPALAGVEIGTAELRARFEHDYRALVSRLMIENHYGRAAELLAARGLELVAEAGHGGYPRVDALWALGVAHVPMGEFWNGKQFWVTKEAASAAHIYGRRDVAAEAMTGWRHWRDGPAEYKRLCDIAFCAGLTRPVFHTFAHNPPSAGKPGFAYHAGEHFNVNSTWWEQSGPLLRYLARCSHMLRQGDFVADVCFYYGDDAPGIVPSRRIDPKVAPPHGELECQHCGRPMPNRVDRLPPGHDFDYVNSDVIVRDMQVRDMQVRDGRLTLSSGMEYRLIAIPDRDDIALPVLRKLEQLVRDGATLVGRRPQRSSSLAGYPECDAEVQRLAGLLWGEDDRSAHQHGRGRVYAAEALGSALQELGVEPDFRVDAPAAHELDWIHRRTPTAEIYFVVNGSDQPAHAECSFRVPATWQPSLWSPDDGSITPCPTWRADGGRIHVPLQLQPLASVFVVFRDGAPRDHVVDLGPVGRTAPHLADPDIEVLALGPDRLRARARTAGTFTMRSARGRSATVDVAAPPAGLAVESGWQLRFPVQSGAPESIELRSLCSWTELEPADARYFAGTATYRTDVDIPPDWLDGRFALELDLGTVAEIAAVSVNGDAAGLLWKPPFRADVTHLLRPGVNRLEIRVTNVWHNRIVGDLRSPDAPPHVSTNLLGRFRADLELLPSGLLGPVVVRPVAVVDVPLK